jgi:hypothetical protein
LAKGFSNIIRMHKQLLFFLITILSLASCGTDSKHFEIEGRILNMNQGEFYVYDDHGFISGIDTIKVEGGRFVYKMECERPTTVMLVFPNFSEQPIFAESNKSVTIKGDASHLKMLSVKGTSTNELMTKFREQISNASPPETKKYASRFIEDHPKSLVAPYLLKKYFINTAEPNFKEAYRLLQIISVKQPNNVQLTRLSKQIDNLRKSTVGNPLPTFTAYDMKGKLVSSSDLSSGLAVICAWASWSYESTDQLRYIQRAQKKSQGRLKTVSISLDASRRDCKNVLDRDSIPWPNICDGKIFESKPIQLLGLTSVPDNILIKNGKIIARSLSTADLQDTIEKNL